MYFAVPVSKREYSVEKRRVYPGKEYADKRIDKEESGE
jgi:hypothetical protein